MIDEIKAFLKDHANHTLDYLREYLQHKTLQILDQQQLSGRLSFLGGTALHILYDTQRFSEDLDFSLLSPDWLAVDEFAALCERQFALLGLPMKASKRKAAPVQGFFMDFPGLLHQVGLSPHKNQNFSIKLEIDTRPPAGATQVQDIVNKYFYYKVTHPDLPSMFAGKCHALIYRAYPKGRDYFDLFFYLSKKIQANFDHFVNAARQTHPADTFKQSLDLYQRLATVVGAMDEAKIQADLRPFLLNPTDVRCASKEFLSLALQPYLLQ